MNPSQSNHESLVSYLELALKQVKKAQTEYNEKLTQYDIRSLSYQILKELIMEQISNENSNTTAR
jgi:hypothetical protein